MAEDVRALALEVLRLAEVTLTPELADAGVALARAVLASPAVESAPAASPEPGDDEDRRHLVRVAARRASREDESATAVSPEPGASSGESTTNKEQTMNEPILQFFAYEHLPPKLQAVSRSFCELARAICGVEASMPAGTSTEFPLPRNPERTVALRKLLEAKDAAVRAATSRPDRGARLAPDGVGLVEDK